MGGRLVEAGAVRAENEGRSKKCFYLWLAIAVIHEMCRSKLKSLDGEREGGRDVLQQAVWCSSSSSSSCVACPVDVAVFHDFVLDDR